MRRNKTKNLTIGLGILVITGLVFTLTPLGAAQPTKSKRSEFMRQKLEFSKNIIEGLSLEQFALVEKNARALKVLSQAAEWEVPTIPNATDYVALTTEFQRYTDELARNAKQRNIDGATLAYLKLTMNCVQCHKYVRFASQ